MRPFCSERPPHLVAGVLRAFQDPGQLGAATDQGGLASRSVLEELSCNGVLRLAIQLRHGSPQHIKDRLKCQRLPEEADVGLLPPMRVEVTNELPQRRRSAAADTRPRRED